MAICDRFVDGLFETSQISGGGGRELDAASNMPGSLARLANLGFNGRKHTEEGLVSS